jgi:starch synthase
MNIVFIASEAIPFAKTGGLADVCGSLPVALESLGHEVSVILPYYHMVGEKPAFNDAARIDKLGKAVKVYFLKGKKFFDRPYIYGGSDGDYPDNLDRFSFFCHEALRFIRDLGKPVDVIHCHDWPTGLVPLLLKSKYATDPFFANTKSVMTIHNLAYQGVFPAEDFPKLGVDGRFFNEEQVEYFGKINLLKTGIVFSDYVTTVSPQYAKEILSQEWGCGLEGVLLKRKKTLIGILNGLDYGFWDPERDGLIDPHYSAHDWLAKKIHKENLQALARLPVLSDIPVFGFVGRLFYQKGLDIIESAFAGLMERPVQLVFLGVGEEKYQRLLVKLSKAHPQKCAAFIRYDEPLAHKVYAGADFFLMPSVYEPCGLAQMIALRYGTIPVVSAVGGILDTITDLSVTRQKGNGLLFHSYSVSGLLEAVDRAVGIYYQKEHFAELLERGMACRWTWESSAKQYLEVYEECLNKEVDKVGKVFEVFPRP